jgi:hypothetical protein
MMFAFRQAQTNSDTVNERTASKHLQGGLLVFLDVEQLVELGDLENFVNLRVDIAQDESAARGLQFLVQGDQLPQGRAGKVLDVAEVQEDFFSAMLVDQTEELFADKLDVLLVEDFLIGEINHGHIADVLHFQATTARLGRHEDHSLCEQSQEGLPRWLMLSKMKITIEFRLQTLEVKQFLPIQIRAKP